MAKTNNRLAKELSKLQKAFHVGMNLKVEWTPTDIKPNSRMEAKPLSGCIAGNIITIFDKDEAKGESMLTRRGDTFTVSFIICASEKRLDVLTRNFSEIMQKPVGLDSTAARSNPTRLLECN